jgi:hypothetical protein
MDLLRELKSGHSRTDTHIYNEMTIVQVVILRTGMNDYNHLHWSTMSVLIRNKAVLFFCLK